MKKVSFGGDYIMLTGERGRPEGRDPLRVVSPIGEFRGRRGYPPPRGGGED